jgi:large subunit ribosomal protein L30
VAKAVKKTKEHTPVVLRIKQVRSGSGRPETHRATLRALGLRHHQHIVYQKDNPAIRGMLFQVRHLVDVQEVAEGEA